MLYYSIFSSLFVYFDEFIHSDMNATIFNQHTYKSDYRRLLSFLTLAVEYTTPIALGPISGAGVLLKTYSEITN